MNNRTHAVRRGQQPNIVHLDPPRDKNDELLELFIDYLVPRGVTPDQATDNGFLPVYDSDERAQKIATVRYHANHRKELGLESLPGFLIQYSEDYHTFRYLCEEQYYPTQDVNKRDGKPVKIASPAGRGSRPFLSKLFLSMKPPKGSRVYLCPEGHPKLLHLWPPKLLQAGRSDYGVWGRCLGWLFRLISPCWCFKNQWAPVLPVGQRPP